ncbi:MAG: hypothetical protein HYX22_02765 [Candidatus Yanofskybacteria bacterium]|nr:hypothetical protein [Candidatus Yanofskybacteria bacterium]
MEYNFNPALIWSIRVISFVALVLTIYATVNILQSIWFRFWSSRAMDDREKREFYVRTRYDVKWSFSLAVVMMLGSLMFQLMGLIKPAGLMLLLFFLFCLLFWGNYRTLKIEIERERRRLEMRKSFGI